MKNLIGFILLFASFAVEAQITYNETRADAFENAQRDSTYRRKIRDSHILSSKLYKYSSQHSTDAGKGRLTEEVLYDGQGNFIGYKIFNRRGKIKYYYTYSYDGKNRIVEESSLKSNGKMILRMAYTYDAAGNKTDEREFFKKPDYVYWHSISTFDEKQNILELKYLTKNDKKVGMKYTYAYYPDGSKKQTIEYNPKGKVTHIWNYDCNPAGTLVAKNLKDTSKICIRYETDKDGNQIKIKDENVKHKNIVRIVSKFNKNDNMIDRVQYDIKGRARFHSTGKFNDKNDLTEFTVLNCLTNKIKERFVYTYDTNGNIIEEIAYKKSPDPNYILKFNYTQEQ